MTTRVPGVERKSESPVRLSTFFQCRFLFVFIIIRDRASIHRVDLHVVELDFAPADNFVEHVMDVAGLHNLVEFLKEHRHVYDFLYGLHVFTDDSIHSVLFTRALFKTASDIGHRHVLAGLCKCSPL